MREGGFTAECSPPFKGFRERSPARWADQRNGGGARLASGEAREEMVLEDMSSCILPVVLASEVGSSAEGHPAMKKDSVIHRTSLETASFDVRERTCIGGGCCG